MDYKQLLIKYIQHVMDEEGTSFLNIWYEGDNLTKEEFKELQSLVPPSKPVDGPLQRSKEWINQTKENLSNSLNAMKYVKVITE